MYIVLSDSMVPTFHAGDAVIIQKVPVEELKTHDVIIFNAFDTNDTLVTHRIVSIEKEGKKAFYVTKGDNNNVVDKDKIQASAIIGKYLFPIPKIGLYLDYIKTTPMGLAAIALSGAIAIGGTYAWFTGSSTLAGSNFTTGKVAVNIYTWDGTSKTNDPTLAPFLAVPILPRVPLVLFCHRTAGKHLLT